MQQHIVQTCYTHTHSAIPTAGLGVLAGAVILYFLKSKGRRAAAVNWIALVLCILPAIAAFLPSCPAIPIAGINTPYLNKLVCVCVCVCVCVHIKPPSTAHSPLMMSSSHPATLTATVHPLSLSQCVEQMVSPTSLPVEEAVRRGYWTVHPT